MGHPVFENITRIVTWWLAWLLLGAGQSLLLYYAYDRDTLMSISDGLISMILYSGLALAAWFPLKYFNNTAKKMPLLIVNLFATGAFVIIIWLFLTRSVMVTLLPDPDGYTTFWQSTSSYRIGLGVLLCILVFLTYYLILSYKNLSDKKLEESRLENLLRETELQMLRTQINPHFLFNSLNSVSALTITDPERAREMVIKLSDFMRYALARKEEQKVAIRQELENLRIYLDIEKTRFGERLATVENIGEECLDIKIPNLLLQPLYENAVKYGVHESTGTVTISTNVICEGTHVEISISNNFDPGAILPAGTGTGLKNVQRRLDLIYGREASMVTKKETDRFTVVVKIPLATSH
ncbi:MAG: histidine kinase [Bacteroidales bacterium]|nr:histidine kinase [Bacteroidales bacterium]